MPPISRISSVLQDPRRQSSILMRSDEHHGRDRTDNKGRPRNFESMCSVPGTSYRGVDARVLDGRPNARYDITSSELTAMTPYVRTTPIVEGSSLRTVKRKKFEVNDRAIPLETDDMINLRQPRVMY